MARVARFLEPGLPYHVTQRGNYRQDVFASDDDRCEYLDLLKRYATKYDLELWGYCLMSNHVHLIAYPTLPTSLARALATTHMVYAQRQHKRHGVVGHLWQGRFFSCALDDEHLVQAIRYVEMNPVRAGMVGRPDEWEWSSARYHLGQRQDVLLENARWPDREMLDQWEDLLHVEDTEEAVQALRHSTRTGRPLGSKAWMKALEEKTGRRLQTLPVGRPKVTKRDS